MKSSFIADEDKVRVDAFLAKKILELSRSQIQEANIYVNNKKVKVSTKLNIDDEVLIEYEIPKDEEIEKTNINLNIIFEDDYIIVINKYYNLVVHPGSGNKNNTLVNALAHYLGDDYINLSDDLRPGIVHRLDKETSGLMVIAKTKEAFNILKDSFKNHEVRKRYLAIVENLFDKKRGKISTNIIRDPKSRIKYKATAKDEGKSAKTEYTLIQNFSDSALIKVNLLTGRTHQIRVHLKSINHPILGDNIYNPKSKWEKLMLCSVDLEFNHPITKEALSFSIKPSPHLDEYIKENTITLK